MNAKLSPETERAFAGPLPSLKAIEAMTAPPTAPLIERLAADVVALNKPDIAAQQTAESEFQAWSYAAAKRAIECCTACDGIDKPADELARLRSFEVGWKLMESALGSRQRELEKAESELARLREQDQLLKYAGENAAAQADKLADANREIARLRAALKPFATHYHPADLHQIGGGAEVAVPFPLQAYKDAIKAFGTTP